MKNLLIGFVLFCSLLMANAGIAQDAQSSDTPVWRVVYYKFKPGMAGAWWQDINQVFLPVATASIEKGLFESYRLFENPYKNAPDDWDTMLMIEYANYAALDRFYRDVGQVYEEIFPDPQERAEMFERRSTLHEVIRVDLVTERKF